MKPINILDGYNTIMPYLIVSNAAAFLTFVQTVFDAEERYKAMRDENLIAHAEVNINGSIIMFADATEQYNNRPASMFIYVDNCDERYNVALKNGAKTVSLPANQNYGRSCGVEDPFGNTWWITSTL
jgi:PhnB protein